MPWGTGPEIVQKLMELGVLPPRNGVLLDVEDRGKSAGRGRAISAAYPAFSGGTQLIVLIY